MSYIDFWKRWKDFSGKTSRVEYWSAIFLHIFYSMVLFFVICLILTICLDLSLEDTRHFFDLIWNLYSAIWTVPFLAMTVRRLRDAGYNKKNLWKLFIPWCGLISLFTEDSNDDSNYP